MPKDGKLIPKGSLFIVTSGAYSDYIVEGLYRALEDIDVDAEKQKWLEAHPEQRARYHFLGGDFFASLIDLMERVEGKEFHISEVEVRKLGF